MSSAPRRVAGHQQAGGQQGAVGRFLTRESHRIEAGEKLGLTPALVMRRMTEVSP